MDSEKLAALLAPVVHAIASKFPKFTRPNSLALAIALPSIFVVVIGLTHIAKTAIEQGQKDKSNTAASLEPQPQPITQTAKEGARPVILTFGPNNQGSPQVHNGDWKVVEVKPIVIQAAKHERVYQLESSGPNYPILMSGTLAENNFIQAFVNASGVLFGTTPEPENVFDDMIVKQIKLDYHTEVEELPSDLEYEVRQVPKDRRFVAKLAVQSLAKVRVLNGRYKGKIGWIYRPLMVEKRLPVIDRS